MGLTCLNKSDKAHGLHDGSPKKGTDAFCSSAVAERTIGGKTVTVAFPFDLVELEDAKSTTEARTVAAGLERKASRLPLHRLSGRARRRRVVSLQGTL